MKLLMILFHDQALVERGFSVKKALEVENLKEQLYIAQRIIYENVSSIELHSFPITKDIRKCIANSRQKYVLHMEEQKKDIKRSEIQVKRKLQIDEINDLKSKKINLEGEISILEQSAEELANKAVHLNDILLFIKYNVIRKEVRYKLSVIKDTEQTFRQ